MDVSEEKGIVYILTNPSLDGWIKIGMSERDDVQKRIDELNRPTNIPLMFRAYAVYYVDDPRVVERNIHALIDLVDDSLHARELNALGKVREREFFKMSPERAYSIFKTVAKLRGDIENLDLLVASDEQLAEEELLEKASRRPPFRFSMVDIPNGAEIAFIKDESVTAVVADQENHIRYKGRKYTMSRLAASLMGHPSKTYCGPELFTYEGEALSDRRNRLESERDVVAEQE